MAPKNLPPAAKQAKIVTFFRTSMSVYTFKELEKLLPSIAGINSMQVKEYLQAIQDEYLIRVEKIGSGNWYWSFGSDAKKGRENQVNALRGEVEKVRGGIGELEGQIEEEVAKREDGDGGEGDDDEMLEPGGVDVVGAPTQPRRKELLEIQERLLKELEQLDRELAQYSSSDPEEVQRKIEQTQRLKESAIRSSDNIEVVEGYLNTLLGDRGQVALLMGDCCGGEYVVGEGLRDL